MTVAGIALAVLLSRVAIPLSSQLAKGLPRRCCFYGLFMGGLMLLLGCQRSPHPDMSFLLGTWQVTGKAQYEVWEKQSDGSLSGYGYRLEDGQQVITEYIAIIPDGDQWVYQATVPTQNEGQTIRFPLNPAIDSLLSFENPQHDFPQQLQYQPQSADRILVRVLGEAGKGFSYDLERR